MQMSFMTNQIIRRNKNNIYMCGYLINWEYFNNLNGYGDMEGMGIMAEICTFSYSFSCPIEKFGDSPYPYPVNINFFHQNGD